MRKFLVVLAFAAVLVSASAAAFAETIPHPGVVKSVDPVSKVVELEDGMKFRPYTGVEVEGLQPGTRVIIHYRHRPDQAARQLRVRHELMVT